MPRLKNLKTRTSSHHSDELIKQARVLYVELGLSLREIGIQLKVPASTVGSWKTSYKKSPYFDDWELHRNAFKLTTQGREDFDQKTMMLFASILQKTYEEINNEQLPTIDKVKLITELTSSQKKFNDSMGKQNPAFFKLSVAMDVIQLIVEYLKHIKAPYLNEFLVIQTALGQQLTKKYGRE